MKTNVATIKIISNDQKCNNKLAWRLDAAETWTNITTSTGELLFQNMLLGDHTIDLINVCDDAFVPVEPVQIKWTVFDTTPPTTAIVSQDDLICPGVGPCLTKLREPTWEFSGSKPGCGIKYVIDDNAPRYIQGASADTSFGIALRVVGPDQSTGKAWLHNEVFIVVEASTGVGSTIQAVPSGATIIDSSTTVDAVGNQAWIHLSTVSNDSNNTNAFGFTASLGTTSISESWPKESTLMSFPHSIIKTSVEATTTNRMATFKIGSSQGPKKTSFSGPNGGVFLDDTRVDSHLLVSSGTDELVELVFRNLAYGKHSLQVVAVDLDTGQHDLDPPVYHWETVRSTSSCASLAVTIAPLPQSTQKFALFRVETTDKSSGSNCTWTYDVDGLPKSEPIVGSKSTVIGPLTVGDHSLRIHEQGTINDDPVRVFWTVLQSVSWESKLIQVGPFDHGTHAIHAWATDPVNNTDLVGITKTFFVDLVPPTTIMNSKPPTATGTRAVELKAICDDGSLGRCQTLEWSIEHTNMGWNKMNSGENYIITLPDTHGIKNIFLRAVDVVGNIAVTTTVVPVFLDKIAPQVDILNVPLVTNDPSSIVATLLAQDDNYTTARVHLNCSILNYPSVNCTDKIWSLPALSEGSYTLLVTATDAVGLITETKQTIVVDTSPPTISIELKGTEIVHNNGVNNQKSISVTVTTSDERTQVEENSIVCKFNAAPVDCGNIIQPLDGIHSFTVEAKDLAGNAGETRITWTTDTVSPETAWNAAEPLPSEITGSLEIDVAGRASCTDTLTFCTLQWSIKNKETDSKGCDTTDDWFDEQEGQRWTASKYGVYDVKVRAKDAAGNTDASVESRQVHFKSDTSVPPILEPLQVVNATTLVLSWAEPESQEEVPSGYQIALSKTVSYRGFETKVIHTELLSAEVVVPQNLLGSSTDDDEDLWTSVVYLRVRSHDPATGVTGDWSPSTLRWTVASNCVNGLQYLNNTDLEPLKWTCVSCVAGGNCLRMRALMKPATAGDLVPIEGWWIVPWAEVPNTFAQCVFETDCLGFPKDGQLTNTTRSGNKSACENGRIGVLCAVCDLGWMREGSKCVECTDNTVPTRLGLFFGFLLVVAILLFVYRKQIQKFHKRFSFMYQDIIRILTINITYCQIGASLPNLIPIKWPSKYTNFLSIFSSVAQFDALDLMGAACYSTFDVRLRILVACAIPVLVVIVSTLGYQHQLKKHHKLGKVGKKAAQARKVAMEKLFDLADADHSGFIDTIEFQQLYGNLTQLKEPLGRITQLMVKMGATKHHLALGNGLKTQEEVLLLTKDTFIAAAISEKTIKGIKRNDWMDWVVQHALYSTFASTAFQVMLVCHAPISQRVFFYFDCNMLPGNSPATTRGFLRSDYSIECYRDVHGGFMPVVILFMVSFVFAIPSYIAFALWQERHHLRTPRVVQKIGFLYKRFTVGSEGWELISVVRKLVLIGLLVFLPPVARAAMATLVCVVSLGTLNYFQPHVNNKVFIVDDIAFFITTCKYLVAILVSTIENHSGQQNLTDEEEADYETLGSILIGLDVAMMSLSVVLAIVIVHVLHTQIKSAAEVLGEIEDGKKPKKKLQRRNSRSTLSELTSGNSMHKIKPVIVRKKKKKLTRAHLKKAVMINRLMNRKSAARTSRDVQNKHERTKAAALVGLLKKQNSSQERLANRLRKRSRSKNAMARVATKATKATSSGAKGLSTDEEIQSEAALVAVAVDRAEERVEERLPGVFYLGDVVWFQRSKKPQRAEIVDVVPIDPLVGVTDAASIQGYMISFLSLKKASKIKFTLPEYIRLEEVVVGGGGGGGKGVESNRC